MTKYVKLSEVKELLDAMTHVRRYDETTDERALSVIENIAGSNSMFDKQFILPIVDIKKQRKSKLDYLEDRVKELESDQALLHKLLGIVRDNEPGKNSMRIAANSLLFKQKEDANITKLTWEEVDSHSMGFNHKVGDTFKFFGTDHRVYGVNAEGITLEQIGESTGGFISFKKDQGRNDYRSKMK